MALELLSQLDSAKTKFYHFMAVVISGMGFFIDSYDLFCISLVTKLLGRIYYHVPGSSKPGSLPPNVACAVNEVALCGTLVGQLFFGWLGDKLCRKRVYGITLMLMVGCSIYFGLSLGSSPTFVMATLCLFQFWLGFVIGCDYPFSATIMTEYSNKKSQGVFIASVFAMQRFGILAGGVVAIVVSAIFNSLYHAEPYSVDPLGSTVPQVDYVSRILLMFGAVPALLTFYSRMKMPETFRYTALVAKDQSKACQDMAIQNLFQKDIFSIVGWLPSASSMSALDELFKIARAQTLIALCGTIPGYKATVFLIDYIGRFAIQLIGFFFMTVFMLALAIPYEHWSRPQYNIEFRVL